MAFQRKLKIYTAVSGGASDNPHIRVGLGRNWNFFNFREEVVAMRDVLNAIISDEGGMLSRLPEYEATAPADAPTTSGNAGGMTLAELAGMDEAAIAALVQALGNGGTEKIRKSAKTRKGSTAAFYTGQSVRVRGSRHPFRVTAVREGEVQVKRADGIGNRRWYSVGRVSAV